MGWFFNSDKKKNEEVSAPQINQQPRNNNTETFEYQRSYSSSKTCRSDPEDDKYILCTQRRRQNGKQQVKQTRVPVSESHFIGMGMPSIFSSLFGGLNDTNHIINSRFEHLDKNLAQDFDKIAHSFLPFFTMIDPTANLQKQQQFRNFQNYPTMYYHPQKHSQEWNNRNNWQRSGKEKNYKRPDDNQYFNSTERDFQIRDL